MSTGDESFVFYFGVCVCVCVCVCVKVHLHPKSLLMNIGDFYDKTWLILLITFK